VSAVAKASAAEPGLTAFDPAVKPVAVLLVSPCLCEGNFGGVQLSGRIACDCLTRGNRDFNLISFGNARRIRHAAHCAQTRLGSMRRAIASRPQGDVLFWHLGMLKLLPLLRGRGEVYLFLHGVECWRSPDRITQRLLMRVDCFLTNSAFTWQRFIEFNPECAHTAHRVVPLGLGVPEHEIARPGPVPAALVMGRMERGEDYKGHRELIRAWPLVRRGSPDAELWIAGGGGLEADLKQDAAESGEASHIRFFGTIPEEEKQRLIIESRCLALPSKGEGFGLVYLEAMRLGRPCLTSDADAGREVVNPPEAGLSVDPGDIGALADSLRRLLSAGEEWENWSSRARLRYESRFTAAHFEERLLGTLDSFGKRKASN
jgi:phosphatidylinositol alpha-1,6-mannosyltransferase